MGILRSPLGRMESSDCPDAASPSDRGVQRSFSMTFLTAQIGLLSMLGVSRRIAKSLLMGGQGDKEVEPCQRILRCGK